jgi:uncharacterized membrane protein YeiB
MWLGRQDLRQAAVRRRFLLTGLATLAGAEILSRLLVRVVTLGTPPMNREDAIALFGTESMPPLPLFLLSAGGTAVAVIATSVWAGDRFASSFLVRALVATGQLAFTWYVAHIVLGLGTVMMLGLTEDQPLVVGVAAGIGFFLVAAVASFLWRRRFRHGPLEWLMRRVAG